MIINNIHSFVYFLPHFSGINRGREKIRSRSRRTVYCNVLCLFRASTSSPVASPCYSLLRSQSEELHPFLNFSSFGMDSGRTRDGQSEEWRNWFPWIQGPRNLVCSVFIETRGKFPHLSMHRPEFLLLLRGGDWDLTLIRINREFNWESVNSLHSPILKGNF